MKIIILSISLLASLVATAQLKLVRPTHPTVDLSNTELTVNGNPSDSDLYFSLSIINASSQSYSVKCRRKEIDVLANTTNTTCWVLCPPYINAGDQPIWIVGSNGLELKDSINAGDTIEGFAGHYNPNNTDGCSLFSYEFFDESDPNTVLAKITARFLHNVSSQCVTSISDKTNLQFNFYPNPTNNVLNINTNLQGLDLKIIDILGKTVISKNNINNNTIINTSNLLNGVYFISTYKKGNLLKTEKLIVNH